MASHTEAIRALLRKVEIISDVTASEMGRAALVDIRRELDALGEPAATPPTELDEFITVIFTEGARSWVCGVSFPNETAASDFAESMKGHQGDDGPFTYDSFEVARYRRVRDQVASEAPAAACEGPLAAALDDGLDNDGGGSPW